MIHLGPARGKSFIGLNQYFSGSTKTHFGPTLHHSIMISYRLLFCDVRNVEKAIHNSIEEGNLIDKTSKAL